MQSLQIINTAVSGKKKEITKWTEQIRLKRINQLILSPRENKGCRMIVDNSKFD